MNKYTFNIEGTSYEVEIVKIEDGTAQVQVNGREYQVDLPEGAAPSSPSISRPRNVAQPRVATQASAAPQAPRPAAAAAPGGICSPLPGVIKRVMVREGDSVKVGDTLMVLEAMKMENAIESTANGVVQSIKVREGNSVMEGDVLVTVGG